MEQQPDKVNEPDGKFKWWQLLIYYNPNDPRTIVPKRIGIGYTLNFARPISKAVMLGLLVAIILHLLSVI
jgi:Predicted membrane protein